MSTEVENVFSNLGIPPAVRNAYQSLGLKSLYEWQRDCLFSTNVLRGENLVYCAPTSGGKTLIAELVLLKVALCLRKKAIFVLPYVSLVQEKERHFKKMIKGYNSNSSDGQKIRVKGYSGDTTSKRYDADIFICTIEKANAIVNYFAGRKQMHVLGCVVLDETHVLGSSFNGYLLELLLCKLLYLKKHLHTHIQTVALSATIGNVQQLADWMCARLFVTTFRPVPLHEYVKAGNLIYDMKGEVVQTTVGSTNKEDPEGILDVCRDGLQREQQVIIFCPTKQQCLQTAIFLHKHLGDVCHRHAMTFVQQSTAYRCGMLETLDSSYSENAQKALMGGICYHNSSLTSNVREAVEKAYSEGQISVLCATSTLAAGVNLPAGRVIIKSLALGRDILSPYHYRQMSGRAGRAGQSSVGECYLCVRPQEKDRAISIATQALPAIRSQLNIHIDASALLRGVLEVIGLEICRTSDEVMHLLSTSLWAEQMKNPMVIREVVHIYLSYLLDARIIEYTSTRPPSPPRSVSSSSSILGNSASDIHRPVLEQLQVTKLGNAILQSNFNPDEGLCIYHSLCNALDGVCLDHSLHVIYLVTPLEHSIAPNFSRLLQFYDRSRRDRSFFFRLFHALQIQPEYLSKWLIAPPSASDILQCHSVLRCAGIAELTRSVKSTDLGDESKGNDPSTNKESGASLSRLSSGEWATLSTCKRLYAAMALQALVDGTPLMAICRDFHCDPTALDMLHRQARIYLAKIRHFCKAVGYSSLHRIFKDYKDVLDIASPRELKSLLDIPRMTRRVARALVDNKVSSVEAFVDADPDNLAQAVFIATGFETQDTLETAASSATDGNQSHGDGMGSTSAAMTRDDLLRAHLRAYIAMMQKEARTQLSLSEAKLMEEINKRKEPEPGSTEDEGDASDDEVESSSSSSSSSNDEIEDEEEDEEGGVEEEAMQWKETPALQHTTYRNHDTASPLHKHPRLLSPQRPLVAEPEQFASSIALSSPPTPNTRSRGLRKVTITPLTAPRRTVSTEPRDPFSRAVERYVTDEDLLWLMEDLEARGLLVSTAAPDAGNYIEAAGDTMAMPENNVVHYNFVPMEHLEEGNGPMGQTPYRQALHITIDAPLLPDQSNEADLNIRTDQDSKVISRAERLSFSRFEVADEDALLRFMDEFEGSFVPVSDALPGPPMQAEPVASTALLPAITPAERKRSRAALRSPYLTPFIPSGRRSSPVAGQFLCVPRSLPEFSFSLSPSTHSTPLILPQTVSSSVLLHSLADPSAAQHLFRLLQEDVTPQISLEVIYRPLPAAFLNSSLYADSYGSRARVQFLRDGVRSWMSFVSPRATSVSRPCGLPSDLSLPPPLAPRSSGGSRGTALVLIGAVLCMTNMAGDAHCFHISLPCPLPLPRFSLATSTTPNSHSASQVCSLDLLPMRAKHLVVLFVGFGTMLHKAPGLRHQLHSPSSPAVTNGNPQLLRSNPLLTVSRNWCLVTRTALLRYWREGGAVAWDFLQHLFGSSRLVLIAPHFPALLALLQERDMHCESILRDPIVARELLRLANADPPAECHEKVSEAEVVVKGRRYLISSNPTAIGVTSDWLHMEPTKRSILIAAARAFLSLRGHVAVERTLLDGSFDALRGLYHNIECPLLRCAGEMHATGISVDSPQLSAMTREVAERRDVVLWLLQRASGSASFNPDSSSDCRRLVAVIEAQGRRLFARRYRATPHDTQIGKTHQSPFVQSRPYAAQRSDWSAGRSPIHSIAVPTTAGVENLAEEDFISEYLASHPVRCLLSEWHTHSLALPLLRGILRYRAGGRVCAYFNVVGSETGRLVAVQPPIQSLSKAINIFSLPSKRTVWDEVRDALHKAFAPALAALNRSLVRSAENCYLVASLLSEDGVMQANVGAINWLSELGAGVRPVVRLLHVLSIPSSRPYSQIDSMHGPFSLSAVELAPLSAEPLTSLFRGADPTALQAIVSIGEEISAVAEPKYYLAVVPLDQLQRITQPLQPSIEESSIIERSLSNDYDPFSEHDRMLVQQLSMKRRTLLPRRALRAAPGYVLISADYSQIELRLLAHFSGDSGLLTAFGAIPPLSSALNPPISGDVFRALARQWFALPGDDEVSDELRAIVKQVCYAVLYGAGPRLVAEEAGLPLARAAAIYRDFLHRFNGVASFTAAVVDDCRERGYVETLFGRRRHLSGINAEDDSARSRAVRQAVNTMCQGSAADLAKLALVNVDAALYTRFHLKQVESAAASSTPLQYRAKRSHPGAGIYRGANEVRLVLQIHDELVYEVREEISVEVAALVKVCMECAATLRVPLEAKVRVGPSWGELSALEIDKQVLEEMRQDILDIRPPLHPSLLGSASHGAAGGVGVAKNLFGLEDT